MRCANCEKDIPLEDKVCPYCKVDPIQNPGERLEGWLITLLFGIGGFFLGYAIGSYESAFVMMIVGMLFGAVVALSSKGSKA